MKVNKEFEKLNEIINDEERTIKLVEMLDKI